MKKLILSLSLLMALSNSSLYCMNSDKTSLDQKTRIENLRKEVEELKLIKELNILRTTNGISISVKDIKTSVDAYFIANSVYTEALDKESLLNTVTGERAFVGVNWIKENPGKTSGIIGAILVGTLIQKGMKQRGTKPIPTEPVLQEQVFLKPTRLEKDMTKPTAAASVFPDLISHFNIFMG